MTLDKRDTLIRLAALALLPLAGYSQTKDKPLRVGLIAFGNGSMNAHLQHALVEGLKQRGYVEGQNLVLERRYADGVGSRVAELANELAALKLNAIVTTCTPTTQHAAKATKTIPLVMAGVADPVGQGLIATYGHPGGNITGVASQFEDVAAKMLQLLVQAVPQSSPVAVVSHPRNAVHGILLKQIEAAARELKVQISSIPVTAQTDFAALFEQLSRRGTGALLVLPDDPPLAHLRRRIIAQATKHRIPSLFGIREAVEEGGLISYGQPLREAYFRAAYYVDRIAKGSKPAELSVEQPTKFELVINLRTAKALGLTIPQPLLLRADQVIE
jgi:putative tryptophan/tyrosine transport system substrate-binding protein